MTGDITFSGLRVDDARNNEAVLIDAIADSAGVDKSRVSISIATAARRRLADGVIVTYSIATDSTSDATTRSSPTAVGPHPEECSTALTTAAATNNVASIFEIRRGHANEHAGRRRRNRRRRRRGRERRRRRSRVRGAAAPRRLTAQRSAALLAAIRA